MAKKKEPKDEDIFYSWRYGLIKVSEENDGEDVHELYEIYITAEGEPTSFCTAHPNSEETLKMALNDVQNYPPITKFYDEGTFDWDINMEQWKYEIHKDKA